MQYELVLFDLDGTLLDTLDDLAAAVNHAMQLQAFPLHTRDEYQQMIGDGVRNLVKRAMPVEKRDDDALVDVTLGAFKSYYTAHIDVHTHPYPGMQQLLSQLHHEGVKIAVASNKFQEGTVYLIRKFFPEIPFVAVLGNRPGYPLKPDPEIVDEVLRKSGIARSKAVMVGDSSTDMKTASNGHIAAIAVSWGYRCLLGTPGVTVVKSASELMDMLGIQGE